MMAVSKEARHLLVLLSGWCKILSHLVGPVYIRCTRRTVGAVGRHEVGAKRLMNVDAEEGFTAAPIERRAVCSAGKANVSLLMNHVGTLDQAVAKTAWPRGDDIPLFQLLHE